MLRQSKILFLVLAGCMTFFLLNYQNVLDVQLMHLGFNTSFLNANVFSGFHLSIMKIEEPLSHLQRNKKTDLEEVPLRLNNSLLEEKLNTKVINQHSPEEMKIKCPILPKGLLGKLKVEEEITSDWTELNNKLKYVNPGGRNKPRNCSSRHKVAIIIPYRNRESQLKALVNHLHPFLTRQELDYGIYIVNQGDNLRFNRAMLFNVGYMEAIAEYDWDCFVFHDVDLLPEDDRNIYSCPETPRHMSVAVDTMKYKLPYKTIFGGVAAMNNKDFQRVNGFSNQFWGWGGEDDDMWNRVKKANFTVSRYSPEIARYTMIKHKKEKGNASRMKTLIEGKKYYKTDGINNVKYELVKKSYDQLYTNFTVNLIEVFPENPRIKKSRSRNYNEDKEMNGSSF